MYLNTWYITYYFYVLFKCAAVALHVLYHNLKQFWGFFEKPWISAQSSFRLWIVQNWPKLQTSNPCSIEWIYIIGENLLVSSPIRKLCLRMERKSGGQWSEKAEQNNQHLRHRLHDCGRRWLSADQPLMRSRCFLFYPERQWTWQKFEWLNLIDNKFDPLNLTKFDWLNFLEM